ncbi:MAG: hypothetical protein AAGF24_15375 [Cyanobacteria bacterium P01_H01_bin.121]
MNCQTFSLLVSQAQQFSSQASSLGLSLIGLLLLSEPVGAQAFLRTREPTFFEQGQQRLESEIRRLEEDAPAPLLTVESGVQQWQPITSRAGGFSIWVPLGLLSDSTETVDLNGQDLDFRVLSSQVSTGTFVVTYAPDPGLEPAAVFPALEAAVIERSQFEVASRQPIQLDGAPGQALVLKGDAGLIAVRMYLANERIYLVGVRQTGVAEMTPATQAFLDSFRLTAGS